MPAGLGQPGSFGFEGFHKHEIHRVALVRGDVDPRAGQHLVERTARERAVARRAGQRVHRGRREQHMVLGDIGDAAGDQPLDHRAHRVDIFGGARLDGRRQRAERRDVLVELALGRLRHLGDRLVEWQIGKVALGARVDLVVDVGDVAGVDDVVRAVDVAQEPEQHVEDDDRPGVADMGEVVDRRAADIEPDRAAGRSARNPPCGGSACCKDEASHARPTAFRPLARRSGCSAGRSASSGTLQPSSRDLTAQSRAARDWPDDRFSMAFRNKETRTSQLGASG